ncbi:MAG TPA: T9SS type A sorting domain-containing protein, partial [Bacteroidia bacterium]|nr:T9SS type A sorting domain-containing protein [Bacteroidia bacterium]
PPPPTGLGGSRCGAGPIVITAIASDTVYWYDAPTGGNLLFVGNTFSIPFLSATTTYYAQTGNVCPSQSRTPVIATITPLPLVDLGPDVIANDSTILDAGAGFVIYSWSTSETTQTITVYTTGQYIVTVQDNNGCFNSDTIEVTIFTGIEATAYRGVQLFPNPAANRITLDGMTGNDNDLTVRFLDIRGQVVRTDRFRNASNRISRTYDIETLAPGVYFVEMSGDSGRRVFRLIVE